MKIYDIYTEFNRCIHTFEKRYFLFLFSLPFLSPLTFLICKIRSLIFEGRTRIHSYSQLSIITPSHVKFRFNSNRVTSFELIGANSAIGANINNAFSLSALLDVCLRVSPSIITINKCSSSCGFLSEKKKNETIIQRNSILFLLVER